MQMNNPKVTVIALKGAEDDSGALIMRLNNPTASAQSVTVSAGPALGAQISSVQVCDLLEVPFAGQGADRGEAITLAAGGLATIRLTMAT